MGQAVVLLQHRVSAVRNILKSHLATGGESLRPRCWVRGREAAHFAEWLSHILNEAKQYNFNI